MTPSYLYLVRGDITKRAVDAIVNAANSDLIGGGGVDGAIHRAAGSEALEEACSALGGCPTGQARATPGFQLPARWIIHAVGPVWEGGAAGEGALLTSAYQSSLQVAADLNCQSIAFPAISCGVFGFPYVEAAKLARKAILNHQAGSKAFKRIELVFFDVACLEAAQQAWI